MSDIYYVYIYYRLDTNEPFYVGKGKENRWKDFRDRSNHFMNIINKHPVVCEIVKSNLTENEAFYWEEEIIRQLVFEHGFSIEIPKNNSNNHYSHLINRSWGGEGNSRPCKEETKKKIGNANKGKLAGENHPRYNSNLPKEIKNKISKTQSERFQNGVTPSFKGKHHTKESNEKNRQAHLGKGIGKENGNAKSVICLTTKRIFFTIKEGAKYYGIDDSLITMCCKGSRVLKGKKYKVHCGGKLPNGTPLVWRKLNWNHNKKYRIKGGE